MVIVDSFRAMHDLAESASEMRRVLHDLDGLASAYEMTTVFVGE